MSDFRYYLAEPWECEGLWKHVRGYLEPAIEKSGGRWRPEYVLTALISGRMTLWVVSNDESRVVGAYITQVCHYPEKVMLAVHFLGGAGFAEWLTDGMVQLKMYALAQGCHGVEMNARKGFIKLLEPEGFEETSVFCEMLL